MMDWDAIIKEVERLENRDKGREGKEEEQYELHLGNDPLYCSCKEAKGVKRGFGRVTYMFCTQCKKEVKK